ncbi:MAG: hypothetical protein ACFFDH_10710 [Promethearchaeota archaeon]
MRCRIIERSKKKEKLLHLKKDIQNYSRQIEKIQKTCSTCNRPNNCPNCSESKLMSLLEAEINHAKHQISKIEWDVNT